MKRSFSPSRRASWIAATVGLSLALITGWTVPQALAASKTAEGRAAARKAGQLAAQGKCHLAIPQYNKAYEILADPAILFNRAECLRKIDRAQDALANYQQFLEDFPKAPNRPVAEQRIADLKKALGIADGGKIVPGPVNPAPPPRPEPTRPEPTRPEPTRPVVVAAPLEKPAPVNPAPVTPTPASANGIMELEPEKSPAANSLDALNLATSPSEPPAVTESEPGHSGTSPWVWIGIGAVVLAGAAVAGIFLLKGNNTDVPQTGLGNYKF